MEKKNLNKKLQHRFLVESTMVEGASVPYKNSISEANVKTNMMVSYFLTSCLAVAKRFLYYKGVEIFLNFFYDFKYVYCYRIYICVKDCHL